VLGFKVGISKVSKRRGEQQHQ